VGRAATYNLADLFESVVDAVGERVAVVDGGRRLTYTELDGRANRLAHHLEANGVGSGDHVGLHLRNGTEYLEAMLAAFKLRAVPVNINYRYVARELEHLYASMSLIALVVHRGFAADAAAAARQVSGLDHVVVVDDGSDVEAPEGWRAYEEVLASASSGRGFASRSPNDHYIACTGGTTGLPKGVVWRHEDIFFAALGGGDATRMVGPIASPGELVERISEQPLVIVVTPPLMHVSAHWTALGALLGGGRVVLTGGGSFDPAGCWELVVAEGANVIVVVGNAMAGPLVDHYVEHPVDASRLFAIGSGGAVLSPAVKRRIGAALPNVLVLDGFGSTETGVAGTAAGVADAGAGGAAFGVDDTTAVLDDDLRPVPRGSQVVGRLARRGRIPLGYYGDPEKSAATFVEVDGTRWSLPGDMATVDADGRVHLLGRGSASINTGGEKVFPEEVESAVMALDGVADVLVVGVPDDRWGERVVAVVQWRPGGEVALEALQAQVRRDLAGYKVPRQVVAVEAVHRAPNAKPDYAWARAQAVAAGPPADP